MAMEGVTLPAIELAQRSDPGRDPAKQINEDCARAGETRLGHLAVTCDGMGGHEGGREASHLAVETIFEVFAEAPAEASPPETLRRAIETANRRVFGLAAQGHEAVRPGSTVVAILIHGGGAEVAHVGDSRIYLIHGEGITQLTRDHSMVQQMVDAGLITQAEAANHPNANQISRALGMKAEVEVEVRPTPVAFVAGDVFVLCSDGLCDLVEADEILKTAGSTPAAQAAGQLVDLANARGGHDNITVQVVRTRESATARPSAPVAPTVVDAVSKTVVDAAPRTTEVPPAPRDTPPSPRGHAPAAATSTPTEGGSTRVSPGLVVGLVLALAGISVAGAAIYLGTRRAERKVPAFVADDAAAPPGTASAPDAAIEPAEVVSSPPPVEREAEAPLAPLVSPDAGRRHHRPREAGAETP